MSGQTSNDEKAQWLLQEPPRLPPGYDKHHIVFLEAIHVPLAPLPFEHSIDVYPRTYQHEIAERIKPATIVISNTINVRPSDMDQAPHMQLLAILATGMAWVDKAYCAERGITVVHAPGNNVDAVSEHFLALYFASRKRIGAVHRSIAVEDEWRRTSSVNKHVWPRGPPPGCRQEILGIVGYGALGKKIESLCRALGFADVLISDRKGASQVRPGRVSFDEMLHRSTTICIVCPREPDTINLIDENELKSMRNEALLINIARGGIVNEAALAKALRAGWIFGAATDVLDIEPGGPGSTPLLPDLEKGETAVPNLIVTGHVAWYSGTTIDKLQAMNRDAMTAFVEGKLYDPNVSNCVAVHNGKIWK